MKYSIIEKVDFKKFQKENMQLNIILVINRFEGKYESNKGYRGAK
ncbi:unnamed protein product [marine sediment metagenome]|uniref:Uncharacterized protein n=1 Tax=marine sediment metagenome TaxID=412755 RepID=X1HCJ7_9ZZZZ